MREIKRPHLALQKKALLAIGKIGLKLEDLKAADIPNLAMPAKIRDVLLTMVDTGATVEKIEEQLAETVAEESTYKEVVDEVQPTHYEPIEEVKEITNEYVEPVVEVEGVEDVVVDDVTYYTVEELTAIAEEAPKRTKSVSALTKYVVENVEDKERVDADQLQKVVKAVSADRKK